MKACVCGGSNANCRYCSGSGYVSDATGLPNNRAVSTRRGMWAAGSELVTARRVRPVASIMADTRSRRSRTFSTLLPWFLVFVLGWFAGFIMGLGFSR